MGLLVAAAPVEDLLAGSGLDFEERGMAELEALGGEWRLYAVRR